MWLYSEERGITMPQQCKKQTEADLKITDEKDFAVTRIDELLFVTCVL
jgi:hypothetical protein